MSVPVHLINLDLNKNQLLNPTFQVLASEPSSPSLAQFFYNSTSNKFGYWNGSAWIYGDSLSFANSGPISWSRTGDVITLNIANVTTSQVGFMSAADKTKLDAATAANTASTLVLRDASGNIVVNGISATSGTVGTNAVNPTDIVNLATLLSYLSTGTKYKEPVRVATTANIILSGTQTIDGIALAVNDRILVKNQTNAIENGLYLVKSGAWVRTDDMPVNFIASGVHVIVTEGTLNQDKVYICTTDSAAAYVNGNTLSFSLLPSNIQVDNVTIELASGILQIKDGGVTTSKIADSAVTTAKIANAAVTNAKTATNVFDQSTITGGNGASAAVANYTVTANTTVVKTRKMTSISIGGGTATNVTHNLNTTDIVDVRVTDSSNGTDYIVDWNVVSANVISIVANGTTRTVTVFISIN
jgi:hypothetical protein